MEGAAHRDSAENDNIVCSAILDNFCHMSVCMFDIRSTNTIYICS